MLVALLGRGPAVLRAERLDPGGTRKRRQQRQGRHHAYAVSRLQGVSACWSKYSSFVHRARGQLAHGRGRGQDTP